MLSCVYTSTEKRSEFQLITLVMQSTAKSLASRLWKSNKIVSSTEKHKRNIKIEGIQTWPHAHQNQTKLVYGQPHARLTKHIMNRPWLSLARVTNSRKLPNRDAWYI